MFNIYPSTSTSLLHCLNCRPNIFWGVFEPAEGFFYAFDCGKTGHWQVRPTHNGGVEGKVNRGAENIVDHSVERIEIDRLLAGEHFRLCFHKAAHGFIQFGHVIVDVLSAFIKGKGDLAKAADGFGASAYSMLKAPVVNGFHL